MKYDVQWSYSHFGKESADSFGTMDKKEADKIYKERLAWLRTMKEKRMIQSFEICILVCTKLVQE